MAVSMKRCEVCGGFYNAAQSPECPYCKGTAKQEIGGTVPVTDEAAAPKVMATQAVTRTNNVEGTVPVYKVKHGIDPVVGWFVVVNGDNKGSYYMIHSENNYIGRSSDNDICLKDDETVSRENHAFVTYDENTKIFYFTPGTGRSIVRMNGNALLQTAELKAYDTVEIGMTKLLFIPLCGEKFDWSEILDEEEKPEE